MTGPGAELEREFTALSGFTIDEAYGLTETGLVAVSPPDRIKLGSVGQAVPGVSVSIRDDNGNVVASGAPAKTDALNRANPGMSKKNGSSTSPAKNWAPVAESVVTT